MSVRRKPKVLPRFLVVTDKFEFKIIEAANKNKAALGFVSKVYDDEPGDYQLYVSELTVVKVSIARRISSQTLE